MELNPLTQNQRRLLQLGVVLLVSLFLVGYFFFMGKKPPEPVQKNQTVYVQNSILYAFDDIYSLKDYSDKVSVHYPYLLVTKPEINTTYIYNLEQKKKEKEVKQTLLDYSGNNQLYTKGKTTFYNDKDIGTLCENGFINGEEILCVTKFDVNATQNMLVAINPNVQKQKRSIYISKGIITDVVVINGKTYIGEIDTNNHKNHIIIDKIPVGVPNIINLIYEMNEKPYFAAFKSELNQNTESYYLIGEGEVTKQEGDKIYLYR